MQKGNKVKWVGHYTRLEWPSTGGALNQYQLIVDAFQIIRDEEARMFASRL